ncbi:MAG: potassium-transporting ATPase subunit KdpC [Methylococcales bacterium]|nr:potassium-transporting ATPase subunit KdpC [Methylococcales bacterium]
MSTYLKPAAMLLLLFTLLTGVIYPALVTLLAQLLFKDQANGSLIMDQHNQPVGSALIGQAFSGPGYFWSRPSATSPYSYNAGASSGSNLGPTNPALIEAVAGRIAALKAADPDSTAAVPVDLITASGSGLDPHISVAAAEYQLRRVARVRNLAEPQVQALLKANTENRQWLVFGEPRVNVLKLNLALDQLGGR